MIPTRVVGRACLFVALGVPFAGCHDDDAIVPEPAGPDPLLAIVQLVPDKLVYSIGEDVIAQVTIEDATNVGSVPFHLRFDPAVVQFVPPAVEGTFMNSDGTQTAFFTNASSDEVVVGLSRLGGTAGAEGAGILATFQFVAVGAGDGGLLFTGASVKDPKAKNLPALFSVVGIQVER